MQRITFVSSSTYLPTRHANSSFFGSVLALTLIAIGCSSHATSVRLPVEAPVESRDLTTNYAEWLADSGFSSAISVKSYDSNQHRLHLSVTNQYPVLVAVASERGLNLPRRLYLKYRQMLPRIARDARLTISGATPCLTTEVWEQDQDIQINEESCLSGDTFELAPELVAAVTNSPVGRLTVKGATQLIDRIIGILKARLHGQGEFGLVSKKKESATFELQGLRGQVLVGSKWWETVQVSLSIKNPWDEQAPVSINWEASGRYGAGFRPPPADGYNADMETKYSKELIKYVSKLLTMVQEELESSSR
jgi:hypothetical protein